MNGRISTAASLGMMALVCSLPAQAAPASLENLLQNSPFSTPAAAPGNAPADAPLEFRGVLVDGGEHFFSLYDPASRSSMWVGLKEPGNPFTVQSYDSDKGIATVEHKGRSLALPLKQAKVAALAQAAPAGPPPPGNPPPAAAPTAPGDEAARLAAVAEEVRRRRALRAQSAQQPARPATPNRN